MFRFRRRNTLCNDIFAVRKLCMQEAGFEPRGEFFSVSDLYLLYTFCWGGIIYSIPCRASCFTLDDFE